MVRTGPREYYPLEGEQMELRPTKGCTEAIACLEKHCKLLKGSTNKEVLEVFYQEVGIRLDACVPSTDFVPLTLMANSLWLASSRNT